MRQQDVHDELRARLHETAEAHQPDRARILALEVLPQPRGPLKR